MRRVVVFALFVTLLVAFDLGTAAAEQTEVTRLDRAETDVEVFMQVRATDRQVAAVQRAIASSNVVRQYAHLDRAAAYREFKRIFRKNEELVRAIRPSDLPESFRLDLKSRSKADAKRFASRARTMPGVDTAVTTPDPPTLAEALSTVRMCVSRGGAHEVFMDVQATQAQVDAARKIVEAMPGLTTMRVLTKDDAYAEFSRIFASQPRKLQGIGPDDLPQSIRFVTTSSPAPALLARLEAAPGVDSLQAPSEVCKDVFDYLAKGLTPEQVAKVFVERVVGIAA